MRHIKDLIFDCISFFFFKCGLDYGSDFVPYLVAFSAKSIFIVIFQCESYRLLTALLCCDVINVDISGSLC